MEPNSGNFKDWSRSKNFGISISSRNPGTYEDFKDSRDCKNLETLEISLIPEILESLVNLKFGNPLSSRNYGKFSREIVDSWNSIQEILKI